MTSDRTVERLKIMLADALLEKEESDTMGSYWFDQCNTQRKRNEELSDDFADAVKELTDVQKELDRYHAVYGKKGQLEVADEKIS